MEYVLLGNKVNLLFEGKRKKISDISASFDYNSRSYYVTANIDKILTFALNDNLELNKKLFHRDIIRRYEQRAKEEDLNYIQALFINTHYCFLVDNGNSITLMHSEEY